jgi:hypothetical protein
MPRLVGINHVAVEVDDVDEALAFLGRIFELRLRGRGRRMAFVDIGDQFIAIASSSQRRRRSWTAWVSKGSRSRRPRSRSSEGRDSAAS